MCCKAVFVSHTQGFTSLAYTLMAKYASSLYKNIDKPVDKLGGYQAVFDEQAFFTPFAHPETDDNSESGGVEGPERKQQVSGCFVVGTRSLYLLLKNIKQ